MLQSTKQFTGDFSLIEQFILRFPLLCSAGLLLVLFVELLAITGLFCRKIRIMTGLIIIPMHIINLILLSISFESHAMILSILFFLNPNNIED